MACPLGGDRSIQLSYGDMAGMIREVGSKAQEFPYKKDLLRRIQMFFDILVSIDFSI